MSRNCAHMRHFTVQSYYNNNYGSPLLFVVRMYGTGIALALNKQAVRFYCFVCVCAIAFDGVVNWCLTQYEVVILPTCIILLFKHTTTMVMINLR